MLLGLQKTSLVDYPGRVSSVLFLPGCNLRCPYCHNAGLVLTPPGEGGDASGDGFLTLSEALGFLDSRRGLITGVVISGGEPALRPDLAELVASVRGLGYEVKVDTNGTFPERVASLEADYIAMDLKTTPERYAELWPGAPADAARRIRRSAEAVRDSGAEYEFRITCAPGLFEEADARAVASMLAPDDTVFLQRCRLEPVLDPSWAAGVAAPTDERLAALLAIIREAAPKARLRGVS